MTQEEKIKDLEERIAKMYADHSSLCTDLEHWKKVAAGLKGHNRQLKEQVGQDKRLRAVAKHNEELLAKRNEELDDLKAILRGKDETNGELQSKVYDLVDIRKKQAKIIGDLQEKLAVVTTNVEYYKSLPWYKRIFFKG